jgi:hypothetical protein
MDLLVLLALPFAFITPVLIGKFIFKSEGKNLWISSLLAGVLSILISVFYTTHGNVFCKSDDFICSSTLFLSIIFAGIFAVPIAVIVSFIMNTIIFRKSIAHNSLFFASTIVLSLILFIFLFGLIRI